MFFSLVLTVMAAIRNLRVCYGLFAGGIGMDNSEWKAN